MKKTMMSSIKKLSSIITTPFRFVYRKVKHFFERLSRSFKWAKRMWNNHDWDYDYIIIMIVDKLKDMRYQFDVVDIEHVDLRHQPVDFNQDNDETVDHLKELDEVIEIGERIIKGEYINYTPEIQKWYDENGYFSKKMPDDLNKKLMEIYKESDEKELKDRNDFFNLIRDNHQKWWS